MNLLNQKFDLDKICLCFSSGLQETLDRVVHELLLEKTMYMIGIQLATTILCWLKKFLSINGCNSKKRIQLNMTFWKTICNIKNKETEGEYFTVQRFEFMFLVHDSRFLNIR